MNMINMESTLNIRMIESKNKPKVVESDFRVPYDGSTYNFVRYEPIIMNAPIMGIYLPISMGMQVVRFQ